MTSSTRQPAEELLALLTTEFGAPAGTTAETPYEVMEFDSLVLVELAVDLSRRFDTDISHEEIQEAGNIARTVELLKSKGVPV
ncbi:acyl carrier protein [Streptomyces aculeolatus]|uniref:acyl carrier protein n=1 Tax=Streptomyces TaxID=1883 RepID=UPI000481483F|nr:MULTISPECIES: acyl carrier protein [Streptomyces]